MPKINNYPHQHLSKQISSSKQNNFNYKRKSGYSIYFTYGNKFNHTHGFKGG